MKTKNISNKKRWIWLVLITSLIAAASILLAMSWDGLVHRWKNFGVVRNDSSILAVKGKLNEPYLLVQWPARKTDSQNDDNDAVTFRVPREYVSESTTLTDKEGIYRLAILFELPGPQPAQERPWLKGKQGTDEYKEFMKTWGGKFVVAVRRDYYFGYNHRMASKRMVESIGLKVRDTDFMGLERYSLKRCFEPKEMHTPDVISYLNEKEKDDLSAANCRLDRRIVELISPPSVIGDEEGVFINCAMTGCSINFSVERRGIEMGISMTRLEQWPEYVGIARKLVSSFVVKNDGK